MEELEQAKEPYKDPYMDRPSAARMYDYTLGGSHNFAVDREVAERAIALNPDMPLLTRVNRAFLRRAVRFLLEQGMDQFLDIGSGIPTVGNVHEIVQQANPAARVVYVDIDPIAVHYSLSLLRDVPLATAIQADARQPERILNHPEVRSLLRFDRPVALLLVTLLHFVTDDAEAVAVVRTLRDALAPGSYVVIGHGTQDRASREMMERVERLTDNTANPYRSRSREQVLHFFEGLELVEPGLVHAPLWRPDGPDDLFLECPARSLNLVGVARKP